MLVYECKNYGAFGISGRKLMAAELIETPGWLIRGTDPKIGEIDGRKSSFWSQLSKNLITYTNSTQNNANNYFFKKNLI